jgi:hypothetical protein
MAGDRRKWEAKQDLSKVRTILMQDWDPIGIQELPKKDRRETADEYDSYLGPVYALLRHEGATREAISAYLFDIAAHHMGLVHQPGLTARCDQAAVALVALRSQFELH